MRSEPVIHYTHASRSGAALYVYNLVLAQHEAGLDVRLYCPSDFEYASSLLAQGVRVRPRLSLISGSNKVTKLWSMVRQALVGPWSVREGRSAGIVHVNFPGLSALGCVILLVLRARGFRTVLTVHDPLPHRWLLPSRARGIEMGILGLLYRLADRLVVHDAKGRDLLTHRFRLSPSRLEVIAHGPYALNGDGGMPQGDGTLTALLFGSIRRNKGVDLAIRAVQRLRGQGEKLRLIIAGQPYQGEQAYWDECLALVHADSEGIEVLDRFIPDQELPGLIARSHLFLLPYVDFNSQSGVAALALANGRVIVASRSGGLEDLHHLQGAAVPIEAPTEASVAEALLVAVRLGSEQLIRRGQDARAHYMAQYSWSTIARQYVAFYRRLSEGQR